MKKDFDKLVFEMSKKKQFLDSCKSFLQRRVKLKLAWSNKNNSSSCVLCNNGSCFYVDYHFNELPLSKKNKIRIGDYILF